MSHDASPPPGQPVVWAKFTYGTYDRKLFAIRPSFGNREGGHVGFSYLKSSDDLNSIQHGIRPKENLVVGSDLLMPFDNRRVELTAQVAMSATNDDITSGTFTDEKIDSIYKDESESQRDNIKKLRNALEKVITVNENLVGLANTTRHGSATARHKGCVVQVGIAFHRGSFAGEEGM